MRSVERSKEILEITRERHEIPQPIAFFYILLAKTSKPAYNSAMERWCDAFAHYSLKLGHITILLPAMVICMIFHRRDIYAKAACFLLWVMIFNTLLKYLFKVPLFAHLGNGYAFPSGHMHASCAFYGYLFYKTPRWSIKMLLLLLLGCLGFSLIHCRFHDLKAVLGAVGFFLLEFAVYYVLSKAYGDVWTGVVATAGAIVCMLLLYHCYQLQFHVWLAFYGLVGLEAALLTKEVCLQSWGQKMLALALAATFVGLVYGLFRHLAFSSDYLTELRFLFLGPSVIIATRLGHCWCRAR